MFKYLFSVVLALAIVSTTFAQYRVVHVQSAVRYAPIVNYAPVARVYPYVIYPNQIYWQNQWTVQNYYYQQQLLIQQQQQYNYLLWRFLNYGY